MMTYHFEANLPKPNRTHLSLVRHTKAQMQLWVQQLPVMSPLECGKQLYQTVTELSVLDIDTELRFELIEVLQPAAHTLIVALEKHYLNQSLLLPIQGRRTLALAQTLRHHVALNYKIVFINMLEKLKGKMGFLDLGRKAGQTIAATAVQRFIAQAQQILLDCYRQYELAPVGLWSDIHNLARVAQLNGLFELQLLKAAHDNKTFITVKQAYLATVLLASSQVNKLRPNEIETLYQYSYQWAAFLQLNNESTASLLVCNRDDTPPRYHHLIATAYDSWYIQSERLVSYLQQCLSEESLILPRHLLMHLLTVWREAKDRMFVRRPVDKAVLLSVGMSAAHYYISHQTPFKILVQGEQKQEEIEQPKFLFGLEEEKVPEERIDAWQICYGAVDSISNEQEQADEQSALRSLPNMTYLPYRLKAKDRSPAGQRLIWSESPPSSLRVGEAIALSAERGEDWGVGVLHWIQQKSDKTIEIGIEILAAQPNPCGVCLLKNNKPSSDYMRGFLIPEMPSWEQPATLMTLNAGLSVGAMVRVKQSGQEMDIQLTKLVLATQSLNQFEYSTVGEVAFDPMASLWQKLKV